jgi:hypothetical protein
MEIEMLSHHTSDIRTANRMWAQYGGSLSSVRRTGEVRYIHPYFPSPLTVSGRRHDVPGKLMSRINQVAKWFDSGAASENGK